MSIWLVTHIVNKHFYIWQSKSAKLTEDEAKRSFLKDFFGDAPNVESRFGNHFAIEPLNMRNNVAELVVNEHLTFEIIPKDR